MERQSSYALTKNTMLGGIPDKSANKETYMPTKITEFHQKTNNYKYLPEYLFCISVVPPNLGANTNERMRFDDRSIDVPAVNGSVWIQVALNDRPNEIVAHATFGVGFDSVQCDSVDVRQDHRRRGIATITYDIAGKIAGVEVEPSSNQTPDAKLFWKHRHNQ